RPSPRSTLFPYTTLFRSILICIGVAVGLAIWKFSTSALVYESRMLIYSSILTESYCLELGESLNALIRDGNHKVLAARLGLTEQDRKSTRLNSSHVKISY